MQSSLGRCRRIVAQRGRNAAGVKPSSAGKDLLPIDLTRLNAADGGVAAVVEDSAGAGRGAVFDKVEPHALFLGPHQVTRIDAKLTGFVLGHPAQSIVR